MTEEESRNYNQMRVNRERREATLAAPPGSAPTNTEDSPYDLLRAGYGHSTAGRIINLLKLNGYEIVRVPKVSAKNSDYADGSHIKNQIEPQGPPR